MYLVLSSEECTDVFPENSPISFTNYFSDPLLLSKDCTFTLESIHCKGLSTNTFIYCDLVQPIRFGKDSARPLLAIYPGANSLVHKPSSSAVSSIRIWAELVGHFRMFKIGPTVIVLKFDEGNGRQAQTSAT